MNNLKWVLQPLSAFAIGMLLILNITLYLFWYLPGIKQLNSSVDQLGNSLARNLAFESTSALHSTDRAALSDNLNRFSDQESVLLASVNAEASGGIELTSRTKNTASNTGRAFQFPIHFSDELLGYAQIVIDESKVHQWKSQAITSWLLFDILSFAGLGAFIFLRTQHQEKLWKEIVKQLELQLPDIFHQLSGTPEHQLSQLMELLNNPISQHGQLLKHLRQDSFTDDTDRLLEQIELVSNKGAYSDVALVSVQCQNWAELIRVYSATELQQLWSQHESLMIRVGELYKGILLPDGFSLAFGLNEDEDFAFNSICAARLLQIALNQMASSYNELNPVFGIAVSAGPAFVSKTHKHGIPLPLVTGDAEIWLSQLKALQPYNQIFIAEPVLQYQDVNEQVVVSLQQDITMRNGQRLEVWELYALKQNDDLLSTQANTLISTNRQES
jgi:hypothetical protein